DGEKIFSRRNRRKGHARLLAALPPGAIAVVAVISADFNRGGKRCVSFCVYQIEIESDPIVVYRRRGLDDHALFATFNLETRRHEYLLRFGRGCECRWKASG